MNTYEASKCELNAANALTKAAYYEVNNALYPQGNGLGIDGEMNENNVDFNHSSYQISGNDLQELSNSQLSCAGELANAWTHIDYSAAAA